MFLHTRPLALPKHQNPVEFDEGMPGTEKSAVDDCPGSGLAVPHRTSRQKNVRHTTSTTTPRGVLLLVDHVRFGSKADLWLLRQISAVARRL
jgi:hypothetical protein